MTMADECNYTVVGINGYRCGNLTRKQAIQQAQHMQEQMDRAGWRGEMQVYYRDGTRIEWRGDLMPKPAHEKKWKDGFNVVVDGILYAEVRGSTGFNPLPVEGRGHWIDDLCCCRYCSPVPREARDNPDGVWDTLATDLITGKTWKVHHPKLHGRRPKRPLEYPGQD